ncbi:N-formylglutamate amidohydrolase [Paraurantiacibacter namhicola]|uniref:N-formylglutamate amidohydrolase n=1 Tax=Paraurantiacibacter namhicola TaxID=645517 RepID=A0A1C7D897_9SPHN|nr:N-formylglutamate amidohydrolase [Paraurantiacibacter namhicola]ANU07716.1 N-formylglutamate amidohydrolase [Paraurantiacibacter namhicola]
MSEHAFQFSGNIPAPPFTLSQSGVSQVPILIAVPHAGRAYGADLLARMRQPDLARLKLEDRLVDRIAQIVAANTGAPLLVAHAPRALLDLNRAPDDMDWSMLSGAHDKRLAHRREGPRARSGLGIIPRRLPSSGEIWRGQLPVEEYEARIEGVHRPYHDALAAQLAAIRRRWGAALLLDLHSMPPLGPGGAQFVVGDRFGSSCGSFVPALALSTLSRAGYTAGHNRPYAGGYVLDRHAAPSREVHAMQLEICRSLYLDEALDGPGPGLEETANAVTQLVRTLAAEVAARGTAGAIAAE